MIKKGSNVFECSKDLKRLLLSYVTLLIVAVDHKNPRLLVYTFRWFPVVVDYKQSCRHGTTSNPFHVTTMLSVSKKGENTNPIKEHNGKRRYSTFTSSYLDSINNYRVNGENKDDIDNNYKVNGDVSPNNNVIEPECIIDPTHTFTEASASEIINNGDQAAIPRPMRKKMKVTWCDQLSCHISSIRETVSGPNNHISFQGPATGQVMYCWCNDQVTTPVHDNENGEIWKDRSQVASVLLLVKQNDDELLAFAAQAVKEMTEGLGLDVLLMPELAARLKFYFGVGDSHIRLFERELHPDFGSLDFSTRPAPSSKLPTTSNTASHQPPWLRNITNSIEIDTEFPEDTYKEQISPDLVCTLGGDGLLMYASSLFPGPVPPILCIAGGSLGFLTPFSRAEMIDALKYALGLQKDDNWLRKGLSRAESQHCSIFPGLSYPRRPSNGVADDSDSHILNGPLSQICVSMRMRLDCRVINRDGVVRARYNVLNELVVDRGSSPYLAHLECFIDDVHLTTVQADGIIFSTPTG
jgi:NAD kinase